MIVFVIFAVIALVLLFSVSAPRRRKNFRRKGKKYWQRVLRIFSFVPSRIEGERDVKKPVVKHEKASPPLEQEQCGPGFILKDTKCEPSAAHLAKANLAKKESEEGQTGKINLEQTCRKAKGNKEPRKPNANQYKNPGDGRQPAGMYNGSLLPIANTTIRGILFYQGENNSFGTSWKPFYRTFPALISDWRNAFRDPNIPFGIIQIAGWSNRRSMEYDMNHHCNVIREIQLDTWLNTANTGLIATYDTNSNGSIHPGRKLPVGERSARWALSEVYTVNKFGSNEPLEWQGPVFKEVKFESGKAFVTFEKGTDRGLRLDQDVDVGFVLAGNDKKFHHAKARITQSKEDKKPQVEIWCDEVKDPVAVRYAFSNLPIGGLMNAREIPAYPFRSDDWPMTPHQSTGSYIRSKK